MGSKHGSPRGPPCTGFPLNFRTPPLLGASGHGHPDTPRHVRTRLPNVHFCPAVRRLPGAGDLAPHPSGWIFGLVRSLARFSGVAPLPLLSFLMSLLRRRPLDYTEVKDSQTNDWDTGMVSPLPCQLPERRRRALAGQRRETRRQKLRACCRRRDLGRGRQPGLLRSRNRCT